ncbi:MAG: DUF1232 domain-containing protein [Hyphomonadaceae bacterium]|nr:DUF1232 domain-containing protein [Hyphomonadaceae bacterium]
MNRIRRKRSLSSYGARAIDAAADLIFAVMDRRTPVAVKVLIGAALVYAVSPIDLIPDFIPVLGQLDDAVLASLALWLASRLTPPQILEDARSARNHRAARAFPRGTSG